MKMTVKSEVQGVVQALFGAYAGGYLAELTAEATANGTGAVAARLASVQGIILGRDLTSNATFINTILGNLGVNSLNPAYAAAAKWATDAMAGGATRADVVTSAVAFLDGVAAGTIVDAAYSAIAKAYAAKVAAGVTYSETAAGSKVLSVTALQTAAAAVTPTDVAGVIAEQTTAATAVASFLAALDLNKDLVADGLATSPAYVQATQATAVKDAPEAAEAAVQTLLNTNANNVFTGVATYNIVDPAVTTANAAAIAANNALEDNSATLITAQLTAARVVKNATVTSTVAALNPSTVAADDAAMKALIDNYLSAKAAAVAAGSAATNADIKAEAALDTWAANTTTSTTPITTAGATDVTFSPANPSATPATVANVTVTFTVGTTQSVATYTAAGWTQTGVTSGVVLSAEVKAAAEAVFSTSLNKINADSAEVARFNEITTAATAITATYTTPSSNQPIYQDLDEDGVPDEDSDGDLIIIDLTPIPAALAGNALAYSNAVTALTNHDKAVTAYTKALETVTSARVMDAELTKLETAVTTTTKKLTDAGYVLPTVIADSVVLATSKSDLYDIAPLKSAAATAGNTLSISGFGATGDDALIVTGFKQAATAKGDNNVVEYFVKQVGADTVITFENKAYGLSDAAALEATVTLVGVDSTTLTFADGLIIG
jgi:hypothetical protein